MPGLSGPLEMELRPGPAWETTAAWQIRQALVASQSAAAQLRGRGEGGAADMAPSTTYVGSTKVKLRPAPRRNATLKVT